MANPAEEIVIAWLQECKGLFTMNNVKVPKAGGGSFEIDILAANTGKSIWVEVSVSTDPRCNYLKDVRFEKTTNDFLKDFQNKDKNSKVSEIFHGESYEKWLVYGKLPLTKEEQRKFPKTIAEKGVIAIHFGNIIDDLSKLKYYRLDSPRNYINLFKTFYNEMSALRTEGKGIG